MTEVATIDAPICATQKCKRPLTHLGPPKNCWRCLVCNPIVEARETEPRKRRDIDKQLSEERVIEMIKEQVGSAKVISFDEDRVREIVQDELQNWHIQKPPLTKDEIAETVSVGTTSIDIEITPTNWRQRAKELGVPLNQKTGGSRKKEDVLADIENKESSEDANDSPVTAEKGNENG